jgi:hypothetical protein
LRDAGFIVSVRLNNENEKDFRWLIDVSDKSPEFVIYDQSSKCKLTAKSIGDVLKLLGGKGGS